MDVLSSLSKFQEEIASIIEQINQEGVKGEENRIAARVERVNRALGFLRNSIFEPPMERPKRKG